MKLASYIPSDEFEQSLRSALLERVGMIAKTMENQSDDWKAIHKLIPALKQQLIPEGQQLGDLVDLFLVYGYDIGLECYKAGTKDMHSLFTAPDFLANEGGCRFSYFWFFSWMLQDNLLS